jgi:threonine/homoserine/homoserine lactone efflux protein
MPIQPELLLPFLLASVLVTVVPGADMALITRPVLVGGTRLAHRTIAGNLTGILVHGIGLAAGLSALIVASATACTTVKLAGAAYLIWLGIQTIRIAKPQTLTLAAIHALVGLVWLTAYAHLVDRARAVLTAPRVKARLERTTGAVLVALGVRVAVERR